MLDQSEGLVSPDRGQETNILLGICKSDCVLSSEKVTVAFSLSQSSCPNQFSVVKNKLPPAIGTCLLYFSLKKKLLKLLISWDDWVTMDNFLAAAFTLLKRIYQNLFKIPFIGVACSV